MATARSGAPDSEVLNAEERAKPRVQPKTRRGANPGTTSPLVVSLLTVVATLGSVALGSWLTASAEDTRADEDFAREQRIETYGEFLGAIDTSYALMASLLPTQREFNETPLEDLAAPTDERYAEILQSLPPVRTLSGRIDVIGGKDAPSNAGQLAKHLERGARVVGEIYRCRNGYAGVYSCDRTPSAFFLPPVTPEGVEKNYFEFYVDREAFLNTVTAQLGLPES